VEVIACEVKARWARAKLVKIIEASVDRREAPCRHQAECGACPWMVGTLAPQETSRGHILAGELGKRLGAGTPKPEMRPTPREFGYRQRLRMKASGGRLGFTARGSHTFVPVSRCEVADPAINAALADSARWVPEGLSGRVTLLAGGDGVAIAIEPEGGGLVKLGPESTSVRFGDGLVQALRPEAFAQANREVVAQILADVREIAGETGRETRETGSTPFAVELFAGSGTLTSALWDAGFEVEAYEVAPEAREPFERTRAGREGPAAQGAWHSCDLLDAGLVTPTPARRPDLVLVDPPRTGAWPVVPWLRMCGARRLVYLACDLAAGLRDIAELCGARGGWHLARVIAYDMFTHSGHQEVLFVLDRRP